MCNSGFACSGGLHEIFVNTAVHDGSRLADLMSCFVKRDFEDPQFPVFSSRMREIKHTEEGATAMCEVMEKYMAESKAEGRAEGIAEGKREQLVELVKEGLLKIEDAARKADMSEEEFMLLLK